MKVWVAAAVLAIVSVGFSRPALAQSPSGRVVVVVVADRMSLADLAGADQPWPELLSRAGIALMNTNTGGGRTPENALATISAGGPAVAAPDAALAFRADEGFAGEEAGLTFTRRTGRTAAPENVVVLAWPQIAGNNRQRDGNPQPGFLGETIRRAGGKTAVLGNADMPDSPRREAALLAMDTGGIVDYGLPGKDTVTTTSQDRLLPLVTDYDRLRQAYRQLPGDANLVVIEVGDMARLDRLDSLGTAEVVAREKQTIMRDIGYFLQKLLADEPARVIFLVPTPSSPAAAEKNLLTPLLLFARDVPPASWLTSPSTRRPGLVSNVDVTATILSWLGQPLPPGLAGRPVAPAPATPPRPVEALLDFNERSVFVYALRPPLLKTYVGAQIVVIAGAVLGLLAGCSRLLGWWRPVLLALVSVPLALLLLPLLPSYGSPIFYTGIFLLLTALLTVAALRFSRSTLAAFGLLTAATWTSLIVDVFTGSNLGRQSILGYDPMAGARYYGIGNEFMGVLVGAAAMTIGIGLQLHRGREPLSSWPLAGVAVILGLTAAILAAPQYGANAGGTIAILIAACFLWAKLARGGLDWSRVALAGVAVFAVLIGMSLADARRAVEVQSHFGRTWELIGSEGVGPILDIAARKAAMNLKLIRYTIWSRVLLVALGTLVLLCYRPVNLWRHVWRSNPHFYNGFSTAVVGAVAALIFNDSGIVSAATVMTMAMAPFLYLLLQARAGPE
ncbi:MAG: hypothetical protein D9V47_05190 [Clostridia bacterium]|nr:MAG: hypothetical protein D9V47_05190 [Clostridia bacterium]